MLELPIIHPTTSVLCIFYVDWKLKELKGRDFIEFKLVRVGLQVTNFFF